jgi:hypothetical protein
MNEIVQEWHTVMLWTKLLLYVVGFIIVVGLPTLIIGMRKVAKEMKEKK